jgi:hypothetical protein
MLKCFGKQCDRRSSKLLKRAWIGLLKFQNQPFDEYYKYKNATKEQVSSLVEYSNMWIDQYEAWEKAQAEELAAKENYRGDKIDVVGFAKLLKKKRKKK